MRRSLRGAVFLALALASARSSAEPTPADRALATELFKQGRELMADKRFPEACARLEESQRLDPGGGTLLNLALCHEQQGRTATAWAELTEALGVARRDGRPERVELALEHIASLEPKLSRLVLVIPKDSDLAELAIRRDGTLVSRAAWGIAMPVDPGPHVIEASAPGKRMWSAQIDVGAGAERRELTVPRLLDAQVPTITPVAPAAPSPEPSARPAEPPREPEPRADRGSPTRSIVGFAVGGLGLVSVGVGAAFGANALSKRKESDLGCPRSDDCTQAGFDANEAAKRSADVSTFTLGAGVVAVALGTYLVLTSRPGKPAPAAASLFVVPGKVPSLGLRF